MKNRTSKAWKKIWRRRIARRRGYGKVYRSFRRDIAGAKNDSWPSPGEID